MVQIPVSSPVERRQILEEIKPWINLLHVDLTTPAGHWQLWTALAWTCPLFWGPGCCLGIAALHWADSPWFISVLHSQLFSPLVLSFQVFFKCSNINLIWEDKEEAWTFWWMFEEVGGCCNTRGYFQCFGLRNKSLPSALRIHEICLYSVQNPHQNIWWELRKLGTCHVEQWGSEWRWNAESTYWGAGELLVIEDQVQLSIGGQLLHLQPQPHFPLLQNIDVPARYQLDHWQAERSTRGIPGTPQDLAQPGLCWLPLSQAGPPCSWLFAALTYVGSWFRGCVSITCPDLKCRELKVNTQPKQNNCINLIFGWTLRQREDKTFNNGEG